MLRVGLDPEQLTVEGKKPLTLACTHGNLEVTRCPAIKAIQSYPYLSFYSQVVQYLLQHGGLDKNSFDNVSPYAVVVSIVAVEVWLDC